MALEGTPKLTILLLPMFRSWVCVPTAPSDVRLVTSLSSFVSSCVWMALVTPFK